jgi:hypothetical protein
MDGVVCSRLGLDYELAAALAARHQQSFGQIEFQVLTMVDASAQVGLALFEFTRQVDVDGVLTEWTFVRFEHRAVLRSHDISGE